MIKRLIWLIVKLAVFVALAIGGLLLLVMGCAIFNIAWQDGGAFNWFFGVMLPFVGLAQFFGSFQIFVKKPVDIPANPA